MTCKMIGFFNCGSIVMTSIIHTCVYIYVFEGKNRQYLKEITTNRKMDFHSDGLAGR